MARTGEVLGQGTSEHEGCSGYRHASDVLLIECMRMCLGFLRNSIRFLLPRNKEVRSVRPFKEHGYGMYQASKSEHTTELRRTALTGLMTTTYSSDWKSRWARIYY